MITFSISGQVLNVSSPVIVAETKKYITASFTFSPDWASITEKVLHYENGAETYSKAISNDALTNEDNFQLSEGLWKFYMHGVNENGTCITTTSVFLTVKAFGSFDGELYPDAPQHVVDQLLLLIHKEGDGTLFLANDGTYKGVTVSSEVVAQAVSDYLEDHPVQGGSWGSITGDIEDQEDLIDIIQNVIRDIPTKLEELTEDSTHQLVTEAEKNSWNAKPTSTEVSDAIEGAVDGLVSKSYVDDALAEKANTNDIPTKLSDLRDDMSHRTVTDAEKLSWSNKLDPSSVSSLASQTYVDNAIQTAIGNAIGGVY